MRALAGVVVCLSVAAPARGGVVVRAGVPFTAAQLDEAIDARGGLPQDIDVEVLRPGPDRLALVMPGGTWEIELGSADGDTAARVVALYVIDLAAGQPATAATEPAPVAAAGAVAAVQAAEVEASLARGAGRRYRLAVLGVGSFGVRPGDFSSVGGAVELTRVGRWIAGGGIAWQRGLALDPGPGAPIGSDLFRARVVGGVALGPAELVAGGFAGQILVDGGTGDLGAWTSGLAAEARVVARLSPAWSVVAAAGAEVFRHRVEVRLGARRIGATPRAALGGGIGLAWTGGQAR